MFQGVLLSWISFDVVLKLESSPKKIFCVRCCP